MKTRAERNVLTNPRYTFVIVLAIIFPIQMLAMCAVYFVWGSKEAQSGE